MELILKRIAKRMNYTIGRLEVLEQVDDEFLAGTKTSYLCDTLEPPSLEWKTALSMEAVMKMPEKC